MAKVRNGEVIFGKVKVMRIYRFTSENFAQKWITLLYNYYIIIPATFATYNEAPKGK
jgi:hypothetical protein